MQGRLNRKCCHDIYFGHKCSQRSMGVISTSKSCLHRARHANADLSTREMRGAGGQTRAHDRRRGGSAVPRPFYASRLKKFPPAVSNSWQVYPPRLPDTQDTRWCRRHVFGFPSARVEKRIYRTLSMASAVETSWACRWGSSSE